MSSGGSAAGRASTLGELVRSEVAPGNGRSSGLRVRMLRAGEHLAAAGVDAQARSTAWWVPGRIEVLGKHTDYAGGRSLLAATEQGIVLVAARRRDHRLRIRDLALDLEAEIEIRADASTPTGHWSVYPATVARRLARDFPGSWLGADVAFHSDLPAAAGLSSSSALVVGFFQVLAELNDLPAGEGFRATIHGPEELAGYLGAVENGREFGPLAGDRGVGTLGGSEDHTALLCARRDALVQYRYLPICLERVVRIPPTHVFAVGSSGVRAEKASNARERYNRLSELAAAAARIHREAEADAGPHLGAMLAPAGSAERLRRGLELARHPRFSRAELLDRAEHFRIESERIVPAAAEALARGDLRAFGRLASESHDLGDRLLGNQIPETRSLVRSAGARGATAASAFGGGFGGAVWALVERRSAAAFLEAWRRDYESAFPERRSAAAFFLSRAGSAAHRL